LKNKLLYKLGWLLIMISFVCWGVIVILPFFPLSLSFKTASITFAVILAEVLFWIGAVFVGKEVVAKYKAQLHPKNWRKKRKNIYKGEDL